MPALVAGNARFTLRREVERCRTSSTGAKNPRASDGGDPGPGGAGSFNDFEGYRRWDLNPHEGLPRRILNPLRLPFRHFGSVGPTQPQPAR